MSGTALARAYEATHSDPKAKEEDAKHSNEILAKSLVMGKGMRTLANARAANDIPADQLHDIDECERRGISISELLQERLFQGSGECDDSEEEEEDTDSVEPAKPSLLVRKAITLVDICKWIKSGRIKKIVVFTGAGISVSSGLPLQNWTIQNRELLTSDPTTYYRNLANVMTVLESSKPSETHAFLALLANKGLLLRNYTLNVDALESRTSLARPLPGAMSAAGYASNDEKLVMRLHGSLADSFQCGRCDGQYRPAQVIRVMRQGQIPRCPKCNASVDQPVDDQEEENEGEKEKVKFRGPVTPTSTLLVPNIIFSDVALRIPQIKPLSAMAQSKAAFAEASNKARKLGPSADAAASSRLGSTAKGRINAEEDEEETTMLSDAALAKRREEAERLELMDSGYDEDEVDDEHKNDRPSGQDSKQDARPKTINASTDFMGGDMQQVDLLLVLGCSMKLFPACEIADWVQSECYRVLVDPVPHVVPDYQQTPEYEQLQEELIMARHIEDNDRKRADTVMTIRRRMQDLKYHAERGQISVNEATHDQNLYLQSTSDAVVREMAELLGWNEELNRELTWRA